MDCAPKIRVELWRGQSALLALRVVMTECSWPCSCPDTEPAPGWLQLGRALWVSVGPDVSHKLRVRSVLLYRACKSVDMCVAWARN